MWSQPAPPSASGIATPVSPNSAAFLKRLRGKLPVSSNSLASGLTSDSANSRTLFCSSLCSSVSSRFNEKLPTSGKRLPRDHILSRPGGSLFLSESLAQAFEGGLQVFRVRSSFPSNSHEIRIAKPTRQHV